MAQSLYFFSIIILNLVPFSIQKMARRLTAAAPGSAAPETAKCEKHVVDFWQRVDKFIR